MRLPAPPDPSTLPDRGIHPKTLTDAGIHTVTDEASLYRGWYGIPYPHRTGVWKTRYRNPSQNGKPKYRDEPGAEFHLYNPNRIGPNHREVWFTEGEFDTLCLTELGLTAVGIHGVDNVGKDETKSRFKIEWKLLFENSLCIVMFDNDDPGRDAGRRLAAGLNGVVFDEWDDRYGDVNEWFVGDKQGLIECLRGFRSRVHGSRGMGEG